MMKSKGYIWLLLLMCFAESASGQLTMANLAFGKDSFRVGERVPLHLAIYHPADAVVGFPDTKRAFGLLEVVQSTYERTRTIAGVSIDTITYQVRCFELAPKIGLTLPYYLVQGGDTIWQNTPSDTIYLSAQIAALNPQPPFLVHKEVIALEEPIDYGMLALVVGLGALALLGLGRVMRKPVKRFLRIRQLKGEWSHIKKRLDMLALQAAQPANYLDELNHIWKDYLDPKATFALRSLTTTELGVSIGNLEELKMEDSQRLLQCAKAADQAIYAGEPISSDTLTQQKTAVQEILSTVFRFRIEAVK